MGQVTVKFDQKTVMDSDGASLVVDQSNKKDICKIEQHCVLLKIMTPEEKKKFWIVLKVT